MKDIKITEESLIADGWEKKPGALDMYPYYEKLIGEDKDKGWKFCCHLRQTSNTPGRDWNMHVDNNRFQGVGSMDIATFRQLDRFIELLSE